MKLFEASSLFERIIRVRFYKIILGVLALGTAIFGVALFFTTNPNWAALLGGTSTGLFVAFLQMLIDYNEHADIEKFKKLAIRSILPHREGKDYYRSLIELTRSGILVLGTNAQRFLEDFADEKREDSRALIDALGRGVKVRILVPHPRHLDEQDKLRAQMAFPRFCDLSRKFPNFECRYFDHRPAHSLVLMDDECLVGPVFPDVSSKDSPAIHTLASSPFVKHYIRHFENEWNRAENVSD